MITICSWCRKRKIESGLWKREPPGTEHPPMSVSHGICPACAILLENEPTQGGNNGR
jgi:hypothetical protein